MTDPHQMSSGHDPNPIESEADHLHRVYGARSLGELLMLPAPRYLIKGVLPDSGFGVIYGDSQAGKTFVTLDMAMAIGRGVEWRDCRVRRAGVLYIVAEGVTGFVNRVRAYLSAHDVLPEDPAIRFITAPVNLLEEGIGPTLQWVEVGLHTLWQSTGRLPELLIFDTLNRCMVGGDENKSEDMSRVLATCDLLVREFNSLVLLVHHSGKDPSRGARGHSSLRAGCDLEIEVQRTEVGRSIVVRKDRDGGTEGREFGFRLEAVSLGRDDDGDPIGSCVVRPDKEAPTSAPIAKRALSGAAAVGLQALKEALEVKGHLVQVETSTIRAGTRVVRIFEWQEQFLLRYGKDDPDDAKRAFRRAREDLLKREMIGFSDPLVWIWKRK